MMMICLCLGAATSGFFVINEPYFIIVTVAKIDW